MKFVSSMVMLAGMIVLSCEKFIAIDPPKSEMLTSDVFKKDATAHAAMTSTYAAMVNDQVFAFITRDLGLYSDELQFHYPTSTLLEETYQNNLDPEINVPSRFWNFPYNYIYQANAIIEGCSSSPSLSAQTKQRLIAEAKFIRAYWYFNLVNFFGDVPILLTPDYRMNITASRAPVDEVYGQILQDLEEAKERLAMRYVDGQGNEGSVERIRPNLAAVHTLLARAHLYREEWQEAIINATTVIAQSALYDTVGVQETFLKNNREAIWQLGSNSGGFTPEAMLMYPNPGIGPRAGILTDDLFQSFNESDLRREHWILLYNDHISTPIAENVPSPFKYKVRNASSNEYTTLLRLSELYLIRAEAYAHLGDLQNARHDLNVIREKAGLSFSTSNDQSGLLAEILNERRLEFYLEGCHRFFDLKRTNTINEVMSAYAPKKGGTWSSYKGVLPIPQLEINRNHNLTQNPGYDNSTIPN